MAFCVLAAWIATTSRAQAPPDFVKVSSHLPEAMDSAGVPGLCIGIIHDHEIVWEQGYGFKHAKNQSVVRPSTVFEAASLSKPVFAYIALKLVEKGKLDLDQPLIQYVSEDYLDYKFFHNNMTDKRIGLITARMVLTHSTGFPNWRKKGKPIEIGFRPGSKHCYSGEGYMYLQTVIEHITARSLNKLARIYVFDPLGMSNSSFIWQDEYESSMAHGHDSKGKVYELRPVKKPAAAYSMTTTVGDYSKFLLALIRGDGLSEASHREMLKAQIPTSYGSARNMGWGLGVGLMDTPEGRAFWHWGDNGIYRCYMTGIPEKGSGMVYFTNSENGLSIGERVTEIALGNRHPVFAMLDYEQYDSPIHLLGESMREQGLVAGLQLYRTLKTSSRNGIFEEGELNQLGYTLIQDNKLEEAAEIFKINVEEHPDSWNVYDSLGEIYMLMGKKEEAIENYEYSLQLNPENRNGRMMLDRLLRSD